MNKEILINSLIVICCVALVVFGFKEGLQSFPSGLQPVASNSISTSSASSPAAAVPLKGVKALYLTAYAASVPSMVQGVMNVIKTDHLNAVVVNVKDGDGTYVGDGMKHVVEKFNEEGVYPIARIVVFQDNALALARPDLALCDASGTLWSSGGSYRWVDPASREVWDRTVAVAVDALNLGFREVNFDYVRFPSDGDTGGVRYPIYNGTTSKVAVIDDFFKYLTSEIRKKKPGAVLSVDLFAYSFIRNDGLGVGQRAGDAAKYFDVISPMVYPSHYLPGNFGFPNPADDPYEVVFQTLEDGKKFLPASSTAIVRPWIQDFNMGAVYDRTKIQDEIRAIKDAGFGDTWMAWNPSNIYDLQKF